MTLLFQDTSSLAPRIVHLGVYRYELSALDTLATGFPTIFDQDYRSSREKVRQWQEHSGEHGGIVSPTTSLIMVCLDLHIFQVIFCVSYVFATPYLFLPYINFRLSFIHTTCKQVSINCQTALSSNHDVVLWWMWGWNVCLALESGVFKIDGWFSAGILQLWLKIYRWFHGHFHMWLLFHPLKILLAVRTLFLAKL